MITINQIKFRNALKCAGITAQRNAAHSILSHVLLSAANNTLTVQRTNLTAQITASCPCTGHIDPTAVPAAELLASCAQLNTSITLRQDCETITVNGCLRLPALPADNFPLAGEPGTEIAAINTGTALYDWINKVFHAAAEGDVRAALNGVQLSVDGSMIGLAATNSAVFSSYDVAAATVIAGTWDGIIPHASAVRLTKFLRSAKGDAVLTLYRNGIRVSMAHGVFQTALIDATYPDTQRLEHLTKEDGPTVEVNRKELVELLKTPAKFSGKFSRVSLQLSGQRTLELTAEAYFAEIGTTSKGQFNRVILNAKYLHAALLAMDGETVCLLQPPSRNGRVVATRGVDENHRTVIAVMI